MWNINIKNKGNVLLLFSIFILVLLIFMKRKMNFTNGEVTLRSDRSINTEGYEKKVDRLIKDVLAGSGYKLRDLRDSELSFVDGEENIKIQLFILKKDKNAWNDNEKIIEIDAQKDDTGQLYVKRIVDKNSRDDIGRSNIMDSQSFFDNFYKPRNWAEQKKEWKTLKKSWQI